MVIIILDFSVTQAKSQNDLFLFCWLCRGTYVSPRIPSSDFSISNLSWKEFFKIKTFSQVLISITLHVVNNEKHPTAIFAKNRKAV